MYVYAVRDDGALLITETGRPTDLAVIVTDGELAVTTQGAALARGYWSDVNIDDQNIPAVIRTQANALLKQAAAERVLDDEDAMQLVSMPVVAASEPHSVEVHTGAMIALVPIEEDAERIAVDGGEDPDDLHLTLLYLGESALIPPEMRHALVDCVARCVERLPTIVGKIFAVNVYNPQPGQAITAAGEKEPCVVWGVDGELIELVYKAVMLDVMHEYASFGLTLHPQHKPFAAHITATYVSPDDDVDLTPFTEAIGPITFNRVRVAFSDEVYDIPLGERDDAEEVVDIGEPLEESTEAPIMLPSADDVNDVEMRLSPDGILVADVAFDENGEPIVPNVLLDWRAWQLEESDAMITFAKERDVNIPGGPGHQLRDYWTRGAGAAKIRWGVEGDFYRCVRHLSKYVRDPRGLCNEYHQRALGSPPGKGPHTK